MLKNDFQVAETVAVKKVNGYSHSPFTTSFETNSEAVQDIMSKMPNWIIRQGITVLFLLVLLLFALAYFIHYPDVMVTKLCISSSNPPVKMVAQANGRIRRIFIQNNQSIKKEEPICLLENPADYNDVLLLKNMLNRLDTTLLLQQTINALSFKPYLQLGELQPGYADLYQSVHQYLFFAEKNFARQKVGQLRSQLQYQSALDKELQTKDGLLKQQLMLEKKKFEADSFLVNEKVIAPLEFDNSRKELINKQMNADATRSGMLQNRLQQTEYLKTITDLQQQKLQQENDLQQKIREDVKRLRGQWELWEQKYLIKSPVDGKAVFFNVWKENQYAAMGEAVLMIVPPVQNFVAKASMPVEGAGKVKIGQEVLIRLASYPFQEFGMIRGKVANISPVALDTVYSIEIVLANGLTTTANKKIPTQAQLTGIAEVVTDDKNILQRLFGKLWKYF